MAFVAPKRHPLLISKKKTETGLITAVREENIEALDKILNNLKLSVGNGVFTAAIYGKIGSLQWFWDHRSEIDFEFSQSTFTKFFIDKCVKAINWWIADDERVKLLPSQLPYIKTIDKKMLEIIHILVNIYKINPCNIISSLIECNWYTIAFKYRKYVADYDSVLTSIILHDENYLDWLKYIENDKSQLKRFVNFQTNEKLILSAINKNRMVVLFLFLNILNLKIEIPWGHFSLDSRTIKIIYKNKELIEMFDFSYVKENLNEELIIWWLEEKLDIDKYFISTALELANDVIIDLLFTYQDITFPPIITAMGNISANRIEKILNRASDSQFADDIIVDLMERDEDIAYQMKEYKEGSVAIQLIHKNMFIELLLWQKNKKIDGIAVKLLAQLHVRDKFIDKIIPTEENMLYALNYKWIELLDICSQKIDTFKYDDIVPDFALEIFLIKQYHVHDMHSFYKRCISKIDLHKCYQYFPNTVFIDDVDLYNFFRNRCGYDAVMNTVYEAECCICFDIAEPAAQLHCGHTYHQQCLDIWSNNANVKKCSLCNSIFTSSELPSEIQKPSLDRFLEKINMDNNSVCQF